jgi:ribosome recycling factor
VIVHDAYGRNTGTVSIKAVAQIVMTSHTMATATCFDPTTSKAVVVAIRDTLDLNPQAEEGTGTIQIPIPRISMEVRQQMVSTVQKRAEQFRVRIRNHRRSVLDTVKQGVAGKLEGVSKDDAFRVQQDIETMTDVVVKELNKLCEKKENDIMSV